MAESSTAQMCFQDKVCERWIGSLDTNSQSNEAIDYSWMGISSTVTDMSECLLNSISVRAAHDINMALAPGAEPLLRSESMVARGQNSLVFPRFSRSSKSPHYNLPAESRTARGGEKRVLFPFTGGASLSLNLAGAVDLTEPLFEDSAHDSDYLQFINCMHQEDSVGVGVNTAATGKFSKPVYDMNNNVVNPGHWDSFSCGMSGCNPKDKFEDLLEFVNCASTNDFSCNELAIEQLGTDLLKREPKPCPTSAFQLFAFKVLPLLRMPEEEAIDAVKNSWDQLPTTEKYAFEMQKFALKDSYKYELMTFIDTMPEATRKIYVSLRRRMHAKFFGFDIYKSYGGEGTNGDACSLDNSSYGRSKLSRTPGTQGDANDDCNENNGGVVCGQIGHTEHGNLMNSGHLNLPINFDSSISSAHNSTKRNFVEPINASFDHHAYERNDACLSLSDPATSFSSTSWLTDEEPYTFEQFSFVEEDLTQEFDSDSNCDSSETSTVTSVVMRPVRN